MLPFIALRYVYPACHARHRRGPNRKTSTQIEDCGSSLDKAVKARAGRELADERILGSGDFVAEVLGAANELEENRIKERIPIDQLADKVTSYFGIKIDYILLKSQRGKISEARSVICHMAINEMPAP